MIWSKETHLSAKFQTFDCPCEISPNLYFDRLLLLKVYKISGKKVERIYLCLMTLKNDAKFEEKLICGLENDLRTWQNFTGALESLKIGTSMGSFCPS